MPSPKQRAVSPRKDPEEIKAKPAEDVEKAGSVSAPSEPPSEPITFLSGFKHVFMESWFNVLLLFVPLAVAAEYLEWGDVPVFVFSCLGLVPLAERLCFATEQMALYTTPTIGGLLNATFGNISEIVFVSISIYNGECRTAQLFLLGSVLGNLFLVLGFSFFIGGCKHHVQKFQSDAAVANTSLLLLGSLALVIPNVLFQTGTETMGPADVEAVSRAFSVVMVALYGIYLFFQLHTHKEMFDEAPRSDAESEIPEEDAVLGWWGSIFWLAVFALFITILSDFVVETLDMASTELGIPISFINVIILPVVGNAAEHTSAAFFAYKNELAITIGICIGSATQILIFMVPFAVLVGWVLDERMTLNFQTFETVILFTSVISMAHVTHDGRSTWMKGMTLMIIYVLLGIGFWHHDVLIPYV